MCVCVCWGGSLGRRKFEGRRHGIPVDARDAVKVREVLSEHVRPGMKHDMDLCILAMLGMLAILPHPKPTNRPYKHDDGPRLKPTASWRLLQQSTNPSNAPSQVGAKHPRLLRLSAQ